MAMRNWLLPPRPENESESGAILNDAIDRAIIGSARVRSLEDLTMAVGKKIFGQTDLDEEKKKLEIAMMKRQLGHYMDDDEYQKELNNDHSTLTQSLLVGNKARRYAQRSKSLVDLIIGDSPHGGFVSSLLSRGRK